MTLKSTTMIIALGTALSLSACGGGGGGSPSVSSTPNVLSEQDKSAADKAAAEKAAAEKAAAEKAAAEKAAAEKAAADKAAADKAAAEKAAAEKAAAEKAAAEKAAADKAAADKAAADKAAADKAAADKAAADKAAADKAAADKAAADKAAADKAAVDKAAADKAADKVTADKTAFAGLSLKTSDGIAYEDLVRLELDGDSSKITLSLLPEYPDNTFIGSPQIETLRDSAGNLVGYYGRAVVSQPFKKYPDDSQYDGARHHFLYLQDALDSAKQTPTALGDVSYSGKMLYHFFNEPTANLEADVQAVYHGADKTASMQIYDNEGGVWTLRESRSPKSSGRLSVTDGSLLGHLVYQDSENKTKPYGQFNGGFYGRNGSVLTGKATHEEWKGVLGATAKPAE